MKKFIIIVVVGLSLYGFISLFFPYSPYLFKQQISYTSTNQDVEEYTQLYDALGNSNNITLRSIGYMTGKVGLWKQIR